MPAISDYQEETMLSIFDRRMQAINDRYLQMIGKNVKNVLDALNAGNISASLSDVNSQRLIAMKQIGADTKEIQAEIAKELNIPREDVVFALDAIQDPVSLFEPIYHDGGDAIYVMDQISDSKNSDDNWLENISIKEAMKKLNDREKLILTLRFFNGRTQMEVADEIGISQAQVSRLEKTALKHMRKYV